MLEDLEAGVYFVILSTEEAEFVEKLIVTR